MASPFWRYFHDKLHWPAIFRPGPMSALAKGLALYMDDVREDILWLRRQWNPATADSALIAAYGASRGIIRQRFDMDESYRRRVVQALAWHRLGGKWRGLERIYAQNDFAARVLPSDDPALWAHFRVELDVNAVDFTPDAAALSWWLANEYKAARSKLEGIRTTTALPLEERVGVGLRGRTTSRSRLWFFPPEPPSLCRRTGLTCASVTRGRMTFFVPSPPSPPLGRRMAAGIVAVTTSRVAAARAFQE
ncbi:phage tail protein [uncultured Desulfovibrio sp.]|uniref:phage tail protein n=1 Tax=uncultured Desulfovibrio sp. TaxID=167968 RepID=UPI00262DB526|nr:phage tail protein [uncultured Desulfovibrio sp.]